VGADGLMLLAALEAPDTPDWMKTLPAIVTLHAYDMPTDCATRL
jgi:predicted nucleic acid binding AN1-type Zn finger protein